MVSEKSTVLIVEDEVESRETLRDLLELEGYQVQTAGNGREAMDVLNSAGARICIMLLDLFMPVMDGWQVIDQLRAAGRLGAPPVVIITSAAHRAPAGIPVIEKPLDLDKVMSAVGQYC